jgi:hypothetical protein
MAGFAFDPAMSFARTGLSASDELGLLSSCVRGEGWGGE